MRGSKSKKLLRFAEISLKGKAPYVDYQPKKEVRVWAGATPGVGPSAIWTGQQKMATCIRQAKQFFKKQYKKQNQFGRRMPNV